jgi:hypothetical protein
MKRTKKHSEGMLVAMTEYEWAFIKAGIPIEDRLDNAVEDFELFVFGNSTSKKDYLDRVRADAREYAGYAVQAERMSPAELTERVRQYDYEAA